MARISEIHYSDDTVAETGVGEYVEVALGASDDPNDFLISLYEQDGSEGMQISLSDPSIQTFLDEKSGEMVYLLRAADFNFALSEDESGAANIFEGVALTNSASGETLDFYDIGAGGGITATNGAAAGSSSQNVTAVEDGSGDSVQFNQPNPDVQRNRDLSAGQSANCFTPDTPIMTPDGEVRAGDLKVGDMVLTMDRGPQPIRYVYRRAFPATGAARPVLFRKGAMGATADLMVSQAHRVLITRKAGSASPKDAVLVNAIDLVNGSTVRLVTELDEVEYIHLMLDQHELLWSAGIASESWQPHKRNLDRYDAAVREELLHFFPELASHDGSSLEKGGPVRLSYQRPGA